MKPEEEIKMENKKQELRELAWKHAILGYGPLTQGKFFLIFEDGSVSAPLDSSNIPNEGWEGAVGTVNFIDPYEFDDWGLYCEENNLDPNNADETEFIENIACGSIPEYFEIDCNDEVE